MYYAAILRLRNTILIVKPGYRVRSILLLSPQYGESGPLHDHFLERTYALFRFSPHLEGVVFHL